MSTFEDILDELRDLCLYGETVIRYHPVRRISTIHFWISGCDSPMTIIDTAEFLATARRED